MSTSNSTQQPKDCCICQEIVSHHFPTQYLNHYPIEDRRCHETEQFVIYPSISPLASGHLLVFPKSHVSNLMMLPQYAILDLQEAVSFATQRLVSIFEKPLIFEHGVTETAGTACGINHAHLHLVPIPEEVTERVALRVSKQYPAISHGSFVDIFEHHHRDKPYLLYGLSMDELNITFEDTIPSQFMRKLISIELNRDLWDWKGLYGSEEFQSTYLAFNSRMPQELVNTSPAV
jgi:diadenosine tetraphosphate (Ap4A) HIT family hydrolase